VIRRRAAQIGSRGLFRTGSTRWKILLFLSGILTATTAVLVRPTLRARLAARSQHMLNDAEEALQSGDLQRAAELARDALVRSQRSHQPTGRIYMTLGIIRAQQADQSEGANRLVYLAAATQHLLEAVRDGVPNEDAAALNFQLGRCLHARNQFAESVRLLRQSLADYPQGRAESLKLLTSAFLEPLHLDLSQAGAANTELLQEPGLSDDFLMWGWRTRREIVHLLGKPDLLADIDVAPGDQRWAGSLARACDYFTNKSYGDAIKAFVSLTKLKGLAAPVDRRVAYLLAVASREDGDVQAALETFRQLEWRHPESPEAIAGTTFVAAIQLNEGSYDQALVSLSRIPHASESGAAPTLPIEGPSLPRLLTNAIHKLRAEERYEQAIALAEAYRLVARGSNADPLIIQLYESWAQARLKDAAHATLVEANQARYEAEESYRKAGALCLDAADRAAGTEEAQRWLWEAANDFCVGQGYLQGVTALNRLLDLGISGTRRARALALLCSSLEYCGKADLVPEVAEKCIQEFPEDPATATARYYLARSQIGFGELEQAELQLRATVDQSHADADTLVIEKARLALAHLLSDQDRNDEAISRLNELIAVASDRDCVLESRLLLGDCLHARARQPGAQAAESQTDHARSHYQRRREADLEQALKAYSLLQRELAALDRAEQLNDLQSDWLRRCRWGMADCLYECAKPYEADRIDQALELYKLLADVYTEPSDWFPAQLQIANCHVRLNRMDTAVAVIRAAHVRLIELPPQARDQARVGMAPERWQEWLEWSSRM
jgi:tetratricopeptide (TPR) repeat protein